MSYNIIHHKIEISGIMPENGWMYPTHDLMFSFFKQHFEIYYDTYKKIGKGFDVAIQAGGHVGIGPKLLSTLYKTVYTFEPNPHSFHCLVNNCQDDNILKFNSCLGKDHTLVHQYYHGQHNIGVSMFKEPEQDVDPTMKLWDVDNIEKPALVNIPQIRIDDLGLNACDLIHLDVEGYEGKVIYGGIKTIERFKPIILFEALENEPLELLYSMGYSILKLDGHYGDNIIVCK